MTWILTLIIIFIYLFFILFLGTWAGRGRKSSIVEYIAASRSFGFVVMYFLMGGAIFSAFAYLGGPGWAYSKGAAAFYILGYCALGLVPWWLWGPRALKAGKRFQYVTQAQLFSDRFQSKALSVIIAIVSVLAFIQYITLQMKGSAYVFEVASGGRIPFWAGALIAYLVVLIYVSYGGMRGVAWTNVFQGAFMVVTAWVLGLYLVYSLYGGPSEMFRQIAQANPTHLIVIRVFGLRAGFLHVASSVYEGLYRKERTGAEANYCNVSHICHFSGTGAIYWFCRNHAGEARRVRCG